MKEEWKPKLTEVQAVEIEHKMERKFILTGEGLGYDDENVMPEKIEVGEESEKELSPLEKNSSTYDYALEAKEFSRKHREDAIRRILNNQAFVKTLDEKYSDKLLKLKQVDALKNELNELDTYIKTIEDDIEIIPHTLANNQKIKGYNKELADLNQIRKAKMEEIENLESSFDHPELN